MLIMKYKKKIDFDLYDLENDLKIKNSRLYVTWLYT